MILQKLTSQPGSWLWRYSYLIALLTSGLSFSVYVIHFLYYRFSFPLITPDEASFLSPAYDLIHKGLFSTSIHRQFLPGADQHTYWMPPLFMASMAVYLNLVGFSFLQAKLFSFLCSLAAGLLLSTITPGRSNKLWVLALWFCCPFVLMATTTIRMEAIGILITCLTIYALKKRNVGCRAGYTGREHNPDPSNVSGLRSRHRRSRSSPFLCST
jgi:hypothetical protein